DGTIQTLTNVAGDQRMKIIEPGSQPPNITVTRPNGREKWVKGTTRTVTWTGNVTGNVKITLANGGTNVATMPASTPDNGSYRWHISTSLADSNKYKVEITSLDNSTVRDRSDRSFTISSSRSKNE